MSIIGTIVIGFIVGLIARLLHPGRDGIGIILTTLLGIAGAMLATYGGQFLGLYRADEPAGFIGAIVGAIIILFVFTRLRRR
ncbi:GlsB/YeaQ/YmgE family stress response membrane protein [Aromatoleum sp.]|uniref:GlsB/YeaQ/YmgE family stress response membrane protein n=1 Tax=Aromatoleum sp. TaxID=2307007 RepID=UPI002FCB0908